MSENLPARISKIEHALAVADSPLQVREVMAIADAAVAYARSLGKEYVDMRRQAERLRFDAERKLGDILKAIPKAKGASEPGTRRGTDSEPRQEPTLADLGIDKKTSARAQQIAVLAKTEPAKFEAVRTGQISLSKALPKKKPKYTPRREVVREQIKAAEHLADSEGNSALIVAMRACLRQMQDWHITEPEKTLAMLERLITAAEGLRSRLQGELPDLNGANLVQGNTNENVSRHGHA